MLTSTLWLSLFLLHVGTWAAISTAEARNSLPGCNVLQSVTKMTEAMAEIETALRATCNSACSFPWERYRGMCLLISSRQANFNESREYCRQNGGDLVWMENAQEHVNIRAYAYGKRNGSCVFYIGLHRRYRGGPLIWTGGSTSRYYGDLNDSQEVSFIAWSSPLDDDIWGCPPKSMRYAVCRR